MNLNELETKINFRTCPLCEATCGLEIHTRGQEVVHIKGDKLDPFSKGYLCPKGFSVKELHSDPDRIRKPMIRRGSDWQEVSWDEAFLEVRKGLQTIIKEHGRNSVAVYLGNPSVHNLGSMLYAPIFLRALGSRNIYSASTLDQIPKQLSSEMMFGSDANLPIPDIDHTNYFLMIGANPLASNGSLMTAPNMRGRLRALRDRGGKLVVIDPVRTVTAKQADEHHFIRPGTDAFFLFALINTLFEEDLVSPGILVHLINGLEEMKSLSQDFSPEAAAAKCGISAAEIRRIARELAASSKAIIYGRMGTCTQPFGTMNSWLVDVLNVLTGNLDRQGGVMFPAPATRRASSKKVRSNRYNRYQSRVSSMPEVLGELPVSCLAEEMETEGPGQIKGFICMAGNPALSAPNSKRLQAALERVDFMVSVDCYMNETSRLANVLLPVPSPLEHSHYDIAFYNLAVRNIAHYSKPVFDLPSEQLDDWQIILHLAAAVSEQNLVGDPLTLMDDYTIGELIDHELKNENSPIYGRDAVEIFSLLKDRNGPERLLDFYLRVGPYGDHFGKNPDGLSLSVLEVNPHGMDFGAMKPRIIEILQTPSGKIELAPSILVKDVKRLKQSLKSEANPVVLVGRRDLRSNNSWLHNLPVLVKGEDRCTLWIHSSDATRFGIGKGERAILKSRTGKIEVPVEITDDIMPGTVSLPHGWGHSHTGTRLGVACEHPGVNVNILTDEQVFDPISGNAVLNGVPVSIEKIG
ncbi:molybdopterin oxidoreductase family protein [Paenibacillus sp. BSR1-1]|uniref:molybdopterin oxidoreductase family protein n=1 Tax=Paenibacillus sp. BSR1-1 TaxID=3020845 RepID=UPI0025B26B3B|nr:molybdopterin oxidoreductase family protein [Paenibacillus sp. BSR1-1]MDN3018747.1 molybdopterin oxidoreductase family protein [Paenibacillus sp. BSR1-1]